VFIASIIYYWWVGNKCRFVKYSVYEFETSNNFIKTYGLKMSGEEILEGNGIHGRVII
jgi:hypothetical protein